MGGENLYAMSVIRYRLLEHTADCMMEITARSKIMLFVNTAYALASIMYNIKKVEMKMTKILIFSGTNFNEMFKDFVSQIIRLVCSNCFLYRKVSVNIHRNSFTGSCKVKGELVDKGKHELRKEIKALTEHKLSLEKIGRISRAVFVLDI